MIYIIVVYIIVVYIIVYTPITCSNYIYGHLCRETFLTNLFTDDRIQMIAYISILALTINSIMNSILNNKHMK